MPQSGRVRVIFVVGRREAGENEAAEREAREHGDILRVDVFERYRNLQYKVGLPSRLSLGFGQTGRFCSPKPTLSKPTLLAVENGV